MTPERLICVTPAKRDKGATKDNKQSIDEKTPEEQHRAMTWARGLKRVFNIDIMVCEQCAGPVKVIACIEDPQVINTILTHLANKSEKETVENASARAPPALTRLEHRLTQLTSNR